MAARKGFAFFSKASLHVAVECFYGECLYGRDQVILPAMRVENVHMVDFRHSLVDRLIPAHEP